MARESPAHLGPSRPGPRAGDFTILLAFPFYWMLITSFKQNLDLYTIGK